MILDHYSATQGRRVLRLMQENPRELLVEMWSAVRNLNLTAYRMAQQTARHSSPSEELIASMRSEAYQSMFPAVETPDSDEMTPAQRQTLDDWLVSLAPAH